MYAFRDLTSHPDIMPGRDLSHVSPQLLVPIAKVRQEEEAKGGAEEAKQKPKRGGELQGQKGKTLQRSKREKWRSQRRRRSYRAQRRREGAVGDEQRRGGKAKSKRKE